MATILEDALWVTQVKEGDYKAFEILYNKYFGRVYAFLQSLQLTEHADDVIQETFIIVWEKRATLQPDKSFNSYLFTIAKNQALKALRKGIKERIDAAEVEVADTHVSESNLISEEMEQAIQKSLEEMPERPRTVFEMKRYQGLSTKQIAELLNISASTVENHMNMALSILKKNMLLAVYILPFIK
ncbi:DNA-directed RNA polymerase sigma-70 factor [Neptunitalea chrysea]|uniref:RNA polymerase sigma factor n=1 Tax=Neptunitalea chrysea TaxID=1647581 RepID=A0A9W6EVI8_9FLAO|nr:RNA polymerase sigma-70 factor [Neptunitalea chrysea]GLB52971.1 DNA-directed RNA polymerase sigma-70 factor [Neptunitalea chrysea]